MFTLEKKKTEEYEYKQNYEHLVFWYSFTKT